LSDYPGLFEALQDWDDLIPVLRDYHPEEAAPIGDVQIVAPVRYPRTLLCSGPNYRDHLAEMTQGAGDPDAITPFFFLKPPTTTVIGPGDAIVISADSEDQVDWEAELGVVIGRLGRDISPEEALGFVAGYTIVNDISARGPFRRPDAPHDAFAFDWFGQKAQDTSCPTGPGVVPEWLVPDPHDLSIRLAVNGRDMQVSNTNEMIDGVAELIAAASGVVTLQPGDVIATGTPAGVGASRGAFLRPGDTVEITIERLGRLRNPVVARAGTTT
jgi:2-keto-4-pentenoate hydratase/2-oxohepta-3-ene-1,7-dioic acid hydratase in catechol pathway